MDRIEVTDEQLQEALNLLFHIGDRALVERANVICLLPETTDQLKKLVKELKGCS